MPKFFRNDDGFRISDVNLFTLYKIIKKAKAKNWGKQINDFYEVTYSYLEEKGAKRIGIVGFCMLADESINEGINSHPALHRRKETPLQLAQGVKYLQSLLPWG